MRLVTVVTLCVTASAATRGTSAETRWVLYRQGQRGLACDLTDAFDLTGPTISHHLRVLWEAGLVDCERRGTWVYYWVKPEALSRLAVLLAGATPQTVPSPA